jgi:hypothetical protein
MLSHLPSMCLYLSVYIATRVFYIHTPGNRLLFCKLLHPFFPTLPYWTHRKQMNMHDDRLFLLRSLDSIFVNIMLRLISLYKNYLLHKAPWNKPKRMYDSVRWLKNKSQDKNILFMSFFHSASCSFLHYHPYRNVRHDKEPIPAFTAFLIKWALIKKA